MFRKRAPLRAFRARIPNQIFNLVEPTGRRRREMEHDIGVCGQPRIVPFVNAVIVQDHVNVFALGHVRHQMIHEVQKLQSALVPGDLRVDRPGSDFQGGKQIQRPVTLVVRLNPRTMLPWSVSTYPAPAPTLGCWVSRLRI